MFAPAEELRLGADLLEGQAVYLDDESGLLLPLYAEQFEAEGSQLPGKSGITLRSGKSGDIVVAGDYLVPFQRLWIVTECRFGQL